MSFTSESRTLYIGDPSMSMMSIAKQHQVAEFTIRCVVYEDLRCYPCMMSKGQFMLDRTQKNSIVRSKHLLNKLKHTWGDQHA